ncbi:MAG: hypothetical protein RLZZ584_3080 [Pseudomonadota bacterium]|jgi:uncharacterized membrane protein YedE/YeeE
MALPLSPAAANQVVLWGGLAIGLALGAVAQASRFCTMGALADRFSYGGNARLMMWLLAVVVAACGTHALIQAGWLDATRTLGWSSRLPWLSCLVGGALFGYGMVLASGCPQRNLVRAGGGNLKSWVTLLVVGLTAQMTLRGVLAVPRVSLLDAQGIDLGHAQDLGSMLAPLAGLPGATLRGLILAGLVLVAGWLLWRTRAEMSTGQRAGAVGVGLLVPAAWLTTGWLGYLPEHPETLEATWMGTASHRPEALTFAGPTAQTLDLLTLWSDKNNTISFGVLLALGVVLGSAASALLRGEFRIESFAGADDLRKHLGGAALMGFGGVTALGCSIGQGITGLSLLSAGAVLAVAGIVAGTWAALKVQMWQLERA